MIVAALGGGLLHLALTFMILGISAWATPTITGRASHVVMAAIALTCVCGWAVCVSVADHWTWFETLTVVGFGAHLKIAIGVYEYRNRERT